MCCGSAFCARRTSTMNPIFPCNPSREMNITYLLQQHARWILDVPLERRQPGRADRPVDHSMVTTQRDAHHRRLLPFPSPPHDVSSFLLLTDARIFDPNRFARAAHSAAHSPRRPSPFSTRTSFGTATAAFTVSLVVLLRMCTVGTRDCCIAFIPSIATNELGRYEQKW